MKSRSATGRRIRIGENCLDFDRAYIESLLHTGTSNRQSVKALNSILNTVIEQELTQRQREVVRMYYFDGKNTIEIAEKLGLKKSTVSRTMIRARSKIRSSLKYCILLLRTSIEEDNDDD